jgi:serine/threonine-protein kinase
MADTVGRYLLTTMLGSGGMASVFLAQDPYMDRRVAIKIMADHLTHDPDFAERFQREAQVVAALEDAYIVPIYDFGYQANEQPFIVMRYLKGGTLKERLIKTGALSIEDSARIIDRVASALDVAHGRGIIHRDFKPHNILFDDKGGAYLSDFGLVKVAGVTSKGSGNIIAGTPQYMSPEQIHGEDEIDHRADIYSMGVTLFEMLTGKPPYDSTSDTKTMMMHVIEPVPVLRDHLPDAPDALEAIILKAMAKNRDQRYQSAGEFAEALSAVRSWWSLLSDKARH